VAGLRERKKRDTKEKLSWAALSLALDRGLDNVRVEDVAAEAGVSPRTFNNYFASKYEAIVWRHLDRATRSAVALRARPAGEPLWDALVHATLAPLEGGGEDAPNPEWTAGVQLMLSEPALQREILHSAVAADNELAAAVAERTGTDIERDLYPRLVAAAVSAASYVATEQSLRADPPVALLPLLREALRQLAAGLPDPAVGRE
jgi:AcrR family transcriptional regulator